MENERVISCRDVNEWIIGCPIRITNVSIISCDDGGIITSVESDVCGDFEKLSYTAIVEYKNTLKETVFKRNNVTLESGGSKFAEKIEARVAYASVTVQSVSDGDRVIWTGEDGTVPQTLPDQEILWQTDQHYGVIKKECDGVTTAKYIPDTIDGAWRCTCGGLNLESSGKCGKCGVEREWLTSHFDREYLENKKAEYALLGEKGKKKVKPKKKKEKPIIEEEPEKPGKKLSIKKIEVTVVFCLTVLAAILLAVHLIPSTLEKNKARDAYYAKDYVKVVEGFYGEELDESDSLMYNRAYTILKLQRKIDGYNNYMRMGKETEALNQLIEGVIRYKEIYPDAEKYDVTEEVDSLYQTITDALQNRYGISTTVAEGLYAMEDNFAYTLKLESIITGIEYDVPEAVEETTETIEE